jgi:NhaP-type Na+/H+ or K+/H+ antiporter
MQIAGIVVFVGLLVFVAHLFGKIFEETKVPDVLMLIFLGVLIGPILNVVSIEDFGIIGPVFVTLSLVVILFQGGTTLRLSTLSKSAGGSVGLTFLSFIFAALSSTGLAYLLTDLGILRSAILGAIVGGTSSAIVIPLVRELELNEISSTILQIESAFSDVLAIIVGLALIDAFSLGEFDLLYIGESIFSSFLIAGLLGMAAGLIWSILLDKVRHIEDSIFTTPAFVFVVFGLVELLGYSGAIAALSFGITLGNIQALKIPIISRYTPLKPLSLSKRESAFFSELVFLIKTFFFVYMGIAIQFESFRSVLVGFSLAFAMIVVRPIAVRLATSKQIPIYDASIMSSIAPKGLAAAVLASIPSQMGIPGGETIQNVTYSVILFSIVLTSFMVFLVEKTPVFKIYQGIFSGYRKREQSAGGQVVDQSGGQI